MAQSFALPTLNDAASTAIATTIANALSALVTHHSGGTAPTTTYAFMTWADSSAGVLKIRNAADSAWISFGPIDETWTWRCPSVVLTGGISGTGTLYIDVPEHSFYVQDLVVLSDTTTSGSDGSNNWAVQVQNLTQANSLKATAWDSNTDAELTADTATVVVLDQNQTVAAADVLEVQLTMTGAPTALSSAQVFFQLRGWHI